LSRPLDPFWLVPSDTAPKLQPTNGAVGGGTLSEKTTVNDSLVRAGVNFKFNL